MFYAHFVLAKKGPLARIWLAAHWDKKLTKAHVYETNIESSVDGIMQPKVKMALRTSGHLLLGVVRIYSRKAKYLLADCNEAFVKIKMAFRPGMVDLPEDKREADMNAITLPNVFHDFDTAMPDLDDVDIDSQFTLNQTRAEEITMREDYGNITLNHGDDGFGDSQLDMEPEMLRDGPVAQHDNFGSIGGNDLEFESQKERDASGPSKDPTVLDAPIHDDGFGGAGVQDFLSAGLFEGGSLFDDPAPSASIVERTEVEDDDDNFPGAPSPIQSDSSRPGTPDENMSLLGDKDETPLPPPELAATPGGERVNTQNKFGDKDTTTLLHNEDESFALAPIEASALKGVRRQRKRKLVVDEIKAITGDGMKAQLSDSSDIVTTLDIAPPTKRLMHWKETGGVEELFNLPGRKLFSHNLLTDYHDNLKVTAVADEQFDTLPGGHSNDDLHLEQVGGAYDNEENPSPQKRGRKRKQTESPEKSVYLKRQEELARKQEEFALQQQKQREETLRESEPAVAQGRWENVSYNSGYNPQTPGQQSITEPGLASPAYSGYAHSMGYPTPSHDYQPLDPNYSKPVPPNDQDQSNFTEQWVNKVQNNPNMISSTSQHSPQDYNNSPSKQSYQAQDDWDNHYNYETDNYGHDDFDGDDYYNDDDNEQYDDGMLEDETIEDFENRVLNKRAALLHKQLDKKFANTFSQLAQKCNRKQVAQKFHSILVLQKMMALDINQEMEPPYADISIRRGSAWTTAGNCL